MTMVSSSPYYSRSISVTLEEVGTGFETVKLILLVDSAAAACAPAKDGKLNPVYAVHLINQILSS